MMKLFPRTSTSAMAVLIVAIMIFSANCGAQSTTVENDVLIQMGPNVNADLVIFFKKGTTWEEVLEFGRTVIGIPDKNGTGHRSLPGMMSVVKIEISGFEGEAINFKPSATDEERAFVKERVLASPLVFRVYENVIPEAVTDLPAPMATPSKQDTTPQKSPPRKPSKIVISPDS